MDCQAISSLSYEKYEKRSCFLYYVFAGDEALRLKIQTFIFIAMECFQLNGKMQ